MRRRQAFWRSRIRHTRNSWLKNCGMIYPMILKKRQILQTLRGFYIHGQGQILMTLSALMYEPHLILYTNQIFYQEFYLFHISSHAFIPLLTCSLQCCLELTVLWVTGDSLYSIACLAHGRPVLWLGTFWLCRSGSGGPAVCPMSFACMFRMSA